MKQGSVAIAEEDELKQFAEKIFQFDDRIRFVIVTGNLGQVSFSMARPGITSLEPDTESQRLFAQGAIVMGMASY